jgi:phosphatidate cytidylyltransferase
MSNFWQRTITGILFVATLVGGILWNEYSFFALFFVITALAMHEFYTLVKSQADVNPFVGAVGGLLLFTISFLNAKNYPFSINPYSIYGLFIAGLLIAELWRKKENPINNWAYYLLGQVIVALPFSLLSFIVFPDGNFSPYFLLLLFVFIWVNDTGAYCSGMLLGKHRLFERISPKKSWEGFFGGLALTIIVAVTLSSLSFFDLKHTAFWLGFALLVVIFGTLGDLCESLFKRALNVKDSGNILPGHGGILDRFDSLLLAAPVIYIYMQLL